MPSIAEPFGEPDRGVCAGIGMMDQLPGLGRAALAVTLPQRHPQRCDDQVGVFDVEACQATMRWANTSTMKAT